jgi:hypothetical protein
LWSLDRARRQDGIESVERSPAASQAYCDTALHQEELGFDRMANAMAIRRLRRGACEYLDDVGFLIPDWPAREFTDEEWDECRHVDVVLRGRA